PSVRHRRVVRSLVLGLCGMVQELHAVLDVWLGDLTCGVGVVWKEACRDPQRLGRLCCGRRRPELERALVRLVGLPEAQRGVQRERELEEDECDLLPLAAPLE